MAVAAQDKQWDVGELYKPMDFCYHFVFQCFLSEWMVFCGQADEYSFSSVPE